MLKRLVEITDDSAYIRLYRGFLIVESSAAGARTEVARVPLDDIGSVITNSHGLTYSNAAMVALAERGVPVALCGRNHLPKAFLLPIEGHHEQAAQIELQVAASLPLKKRMWQQLVIAKIQHQSNVLKFLGRAPTGLQRLAESVRSGDPENLEAQAARRYWRELFGDTFRRDTDGSSPNGLLNYGYTVLRSAVVRCIVSCGLHPSLGIHHSNDRNAYRLADDLIEPFRPFVDILVWKLVERGQHEVTSETKSALANVLYKNVSTPAGTSTLWGEILGTTQSYVSCLKKESARLELPLQTFDRFCD